MHFTVNFAIIRENHESEEIHRMKRRIVCIALSMILLIGMLTFPVHAESNMVTSDECVALLKEMEGFCAKPYWDVSQYSIGYGSGISNEDAERLMETGITEAEAEYLLRAYLSSFEGSLNKFIDACGLNLTQNQFDALLLFTYNVGDGWTNLNGVGNFRDAIRNGTTGNELLFRITQWCNAGGVVMDTLVERRLKEANMYLNGVYSNVMPQQYSYVRYNPCGGTTDAPVQGFEVGTGAVPMAEATYIAEENGVMVEYTFEGWYTSRLGGTQVTELGENQRRATLYAHWSVDGTEVDTTEQIPDGNAIEAVEVVVDADWVNLREGPGLDYGIVGRAYDGEKLTITATHKADGYQWGKFDRGWIALCYTNFDQVFNASVGTNPQNPDDPDPNTSEPSTPAPAQGVMGTVTAESGLCIRSAPGTGSAVVGYLSNRERVEVTGQQSAGGTLWGKIAQGWICLDYVKLDGPLPSQEEPKPTEPPATDPTDPSTSDPTDPSTSVPTDPPASDPTDPPATTEPTDPSEETKPSESTQPPEETKPADPPETPKTVKGTVIADELLIRSGPSTGYSILGSLFYGDRVEILEQQTTGSMVWGKIDKGWISLTYVRQDAAQTGGSSTGETSPAPSAVTGTVVNAGSLRIRSGPGTNYSILGYLSDGEKVTVTEQKTMGSMIWGKIDKGWISLDYVKLDAASASQSPAAQTGTVKVSDYLNVRSGPGTSYSILTYLNPGAKVTITETRTVGATVWGKTEKGWVSMDYIQLDAASGSGGDQTSEDQPTDSTQPSGEDDETDSTQPAVSQTITGTVTADALHVRKAPGIGNAIVGYLYYGTKVEVLETTEVDGVKWGRITTGWICMDYVK